MNRAIWMSLALALVACGGEKTMPAEGEGTEQAAEKDASPEGVAKLADAIKAEPAKASETLAAAGWSDEDFEAALWDIARDPAKSKTYTAARKK